MAKQDPAPKQRWYRLIIQAYKTTAPYDKKLLPLMLIVGFGTMAAAVGIGLLSGSTPALVYAIVLGFLVAMLGTLYTLTKRFEITAFSRMEDTVGGSLAVAQSIRSGWQFEETPVALDQKGRAVVFQGVGKSGVVLLAEGGAQAKKLVDSTSRRIAKLIPGVPVRPIYVGKDEGQVPIKKLVRKIRRGKKVLSRREREAVAARLKAIGGQRLPVPKGIDPMRARPDRKSMRGR